MEKRAPGAGSFERVLKSDRESNGGKLTPGEKKQVNKEQNKTSKEIHKDKHDGK